MAQVKREICGDRQAEPPQATCTKWKGHASEWHASPWHLHGDNRWRSSPLAQTPAESAGG